jgi:sigma-B regulation protein RsbU (phosphoserine phosphatase)
VNDTACEPEARSAGRGQAPLSREVAVGAFVDALVDDDAEQLYDRAPCGYLSTSPDGMIVKVNQTFLTLTGYAREQLVGRRRFVELLSGGGRIYHETHFAPMLRMQGSAREIALDLIDASGNRLPVLVNAALELDDAGAPRVIRAAVFDATDRREYERELLRATERAQASEARATALARTLQQTLIPPVPPQVPDLDVAAAYRPAGAGDEVGGDFYDVFEVTADEWVVVLGDVCGKGAEAAVVTALLRYAVRAAAVAAPGPERTLAVVNDVLLRHDTDRFCTALLVRLTRGGGRWTASVCAAGHPLPVLQRAGGEVTVVGRPGSLLGVLPTLDVTPSDVVLEPGDRMLLYTDGVTEARSGTRQYGEDALLRLVRRTGDGAAELVEAVLSDVLAFQDGYARDDIALLAIASA